MTTIRIAPEQVRVVGVSAVTAGDDLTAQASQLLSISPPAMPPAMAADLTSALSSVASRLTSTADTLGTAGAEMQVRAAAAVAADAPGDVRSFTAGATLTRAISTTASITMPGGNIDTASLTLNRSGSVSAVTTAGLKVTMPELTRTANSTVMASTASQPPDPQAAAASNPTTSRDVSSATPVDGPPAAAVHQAVGGGGGADPNQTPTGSDTIAAGDHIDPSAPAHGEHRAEHAVTGVPVPTHVPDHTDTSRQHWACWMAGAAAHQGLPPTLPVMMALAQSGLRNAPAGGHDVGFFGTDPSSAFAPAGHGIPRDVHPDGSWWAANPSAQLDDMVGRLRGTEGGVRDAGLNDPDALSRWAVDAAPHADPTRLIDAHTAATTLVDHCKHTAGLAPASGAHSALAAARSQLGVHEVGTNAGPKVNEYLAAAHVGSGNPWCASFVTWSMQQSGHDMPGTGWAAVSTWVHAAQNHQNGLSIVDAAHAQPGDIVAYDWGGDGDFASDGHIGFLDSHVVGGHFTAVEGNAQDAVTRMDRNTGEGMVVFIRPGG